MEKVHEDLRFPVTVVLELHSLSNVTQLQGTVPRSWAAFHRKALRRKLNNALVKVRGPIGSVYYGS